MIYLYGVHACLAALKNPNRIIEKILISDKSFMDKEPFSVFFSKDRRHVAERHIDSKIIQVATKDQIAALLPKGAVHQGIAFKVQPLPLWDLTDFIHNDEPNQIVVVLDQVSDPHNVGAILRSCGVFGAHALILTDRNAPKENGTLAKTASGALEIVPLCYVKNLAQTLKTLKANGFWCVAFAEEATQQLCDIDLKGKVALVMGAEGDGVRRLTAENCDFYVKLESTSHFSTLNVSNAAAIALYETFQQQRIK